MANLPTAYASQRFGRKTLDYYAVEGDVVDAGPRARSDERRLEDFDGQLHTVRLMESGFGLGAGDTATVLRLQPGPAQRSRPVAVVNHDSGQWCRTHPGAAGLLARSGVSRTMNWALTMALFAIAALALVWPFLRAFMVEVDPGFFGAAPGLDFAALVTAYAPMLADLSFAEFVAPLTAQIAALAPGLESWAPMILFGAGTLIAAIGVYTLRSWRLLWAPVFVAALGVAAISYGGVAGFTEPALAGLGIAAGVFLIGGFFNRLRDSGRLESRIALLADHLLRQGPQDAVAAPEAETEVEAEIEAPVEAEAQPVSAVIPATAATAAALRELGDEDAGEVAPTESEAEADAEGAAVDGEAADVQAEAEPAPGGETAPVDETVGADAEADDAEASEAEIIEAENADVDAVESAESDGGEASAAGAETVVAAQDDETAAVVAPTQDVETADADTAVEAAEDAPDAALKSPQDDELDTAEAEVQAEAAEAPADAEGADDAAEAVTDQDQAGEPAAAQSGEAPQSTEAAGDEAVAAEAPEKAEAPVQTETAPEGAVADAEVADSSEEPVAAEGADEPAISDDQAPKSDLAAAPGRLDQVEEERLRTDPRYASRAIVLPPPPPMPEPASKPGSGEATGASVTKTLKPSAPLPDNVVPIFAAPSPIAPKPKATETPKTPEDNG